MSIRNFPSPECFTTEHILRTSEIFSTQAEEFRIKTIAAVIVSGVSISCFMAKAHLVDGLLCLCNKVW